MAFRSEALPYVLPGAIAAAVAASTGYGVAALALALVAASLGAFFRDPERQSDAPPNCVLSPADGKVVEITPGEHDIKIAIFLSVFNVHVTRAPVSGRLVDWTRIEGGYAMAFREQASENARHRIVIESPGGNVELSLMAGAVARRIVPFVAPPANLRRGERIALIKFGSRAELRLPADYSAVVSVGEQVRAGQTTIARTANENHDP